MRTEADKSGLQEGDRKGIILFDEMSVQQDLSTVRRGEGLVFEGFIDLGQESEKLYQLKNNDGDAKLATHALQFIFVAMCGWR